MIYLTSHPKSQVPQEPHCLVHKDSNTLHTSLHLTSLLIFDKEGKPKHPVKCHEQENSQITSCLSILLKHWSAKKIASPAALDQ